MSRSAPDDGLEPVQPVQPVQPVLAPQEWALCYQALNALFKGGLDGAPVAVAVLNAMGKIEPYLKAAQAAQQPAE